MAWNVKNIETELVARLAARTSLINILGDSSHIRAEGTGGALYPSVNYLLEDIPSDRDEHLIILYLYIDTQNDTGHNQGLDIAAELTAEIYHKPQVSNSAAFLDLMDYQYQILDQIKLHDSGPVPKEGSSPVTFRCKQIWRFIVTDQS
jgi:hypothetical protein